jgi:hypothetical protein
MTIQWTQLSPDMITASLSSTGDMPATSAGDAMGSAVKYLATGLNQWAAQHAGLQALQAQSDSASQMLEQNGMCMNDGTYQGGILGVTVFETSNVGEGMTSLMFYTAYTEGWFLSPAAGLASWTQRFRNGGGDLNPGPVQYGFYWGTE